MNTSRMVQSFKKSRFLLILLASAQLINGCESFLEVPSPDSKIPSALVFTDDTMAESALTGIYLDMYSITGFASGSNQGIISLAGLSADELKNNRSDNPAYLDFQDNNINPANIYLVPLWASMYKPIYQANAALEGLAASAALTPSLRSRLTGEALFIRGFCYFYLVNIFGDVPLATTTNYEINSKLPRNPVGEVYAQILSDLSMAEASLPDDYVAPDRIRPNKSSATALLARVYLYSGDWARAEDKAANVISKTTSYGLTNDLNGVFLASSREAIWQIRPSDVSSYTNEGYYFGATVGPQYNVLRQEILLDFEPNDKRKAAWVVSVTSGATTIYLPYKYKRSVFGTPTNEYSMVLRLAEIYLIRAEAKAQLGKLPSAIDDLDKVRMRAGVTLIQNTNPGISKDEFMRAIEKERKVELLVEWGHRWLDLKRWKRGEIILVNLKPSFSSNDLLYPIPSTELAKNPKLYPQNPGY